jgi:hypothetical protein
MSTPVRKRLMRDFKRLQQDPPAGISGAPQDNNIMLWNAVIFGYVAIQNNIPLFPFIFLVLLYCVFSEYRSDSVVLMQSVG